MVDLGPFCIDEHEVTNGDYAAWLATDPDPADQPRSCAFNTDFTPGGGWPPGNGRDGYPVAYVDWCDAFAFCAAAGKRLCGASSGGPLAVGDFADPAQSQWFAACSAGGSQVFPYPGDYNGNACNGSDYDQPDHVLPAKTAIGCRGAAFPYSEVYDMSGNLQEWEDSCSDEAGGSDTCRRRGGSYKSKESDLRCAGDDLLARGGADERTGFRCCT